jgi:SAM-dependent methyltransferase
LSSQVLDEHLAYWSDEVKVDRYRRALAEVMRPGATVLDLGSGTGLLALLACEAGAARVYSVESGPIAAVAQEMFARNGVGDRVSVIRGMSTDITLPEPVDLIIGDQIGGLAYTAGVFNFYADAARRFLEPGGVAIPAHFDLYLAGVEHAATRRAVSGFAEPVHGFDVATMHQLARHQTRIVTLDQPEQLLTAPVKVSSRSSTDDRRIRVAAELEVTHDGTLDGIVGMFVAQMSPSVRMSNIPGHDDKMQRRWQDLYPVGTPREVRGGDVLSIEMVINPRSYLATWSIVADADDRSFEGHHSTFEGEILDTGQVRRLAGEPSPLSAVGAALVRELAAGDQGPIDPRELVRRVHERHPELEARAVERLARAVTSLLTEGPRESLSAQAAPAAPSSP